MRELSEVEKILSRLINIGPLKVQIDDFVWHYNEVYNLEENLFDALIGVMVHKREQEIKMHQPNPMIAMIK